MMALATTKFSLSGDDIMSSSLFFSSGDIIPSSYNILSVSLVTALFISRSKRSMKPAPA